MNIFPMGYVQMKVYKRIGSVELELIFKLSATDQRGRSKNFFQKSRNAKQGENINFRGRVISPHHNQQSEQGVVKSQDSW